VKGEKRGAVAHREHRTIWKPFLERIIPIIGRGHFGRMHNAGAKLVKTKSRAHKENKESQTAWAEWTKRKR